MSTKHLKKIILDKLGGTLRLRQFKKTGNIFTYSNGDLTYFIRLQSSQSSTQEMIKVTVNIEIASSIISKLDDTGIPLKHQRHYFRRIGQYLPGNQDKWWVIDNTNHANKYADEITEIINNAVFPSLDSLNTTGDLANLWRHNGYIGLTDKERKRYLELLDRSNIL
jgi:Domain of unknown function (DUF4304)